MIKLKCDKCGKFYKATIIKSGFHFSPSPQVQGIEHSHSFYSTPQRPVANYSLVQKEVCCRKELLVQPVSNDKLLDVLVELLNNPNETLKINVDF